MLTETKLETLQDLPEERAAIEENQALGREDYPFYIVPPPPVPGHTSWSIVPW